MALHSRVGLQHVLSYSPNMLQKYVKDFLRGGKEHAACLAIQQPPLNAEQVQSTFNQPLSNQIGFKLCASFFGHCFILHLCCRTTRTCGFFGVTHHALKRRQAGLLTSSSNMAGKPLQSGEICSWQNFVMVIFSAMFDCWRVIRSTPS